MPAAGAEGISARPFGRRAWMSPGVDLNWADLCKAKGFLSLMAREKPGTWIVAQRRCRAISPLPTAVSTSSSVPRFWSIFPTTRPPSRNWCASSSRGGIWSSRFRDSCPERICWALSAAYHHEPGGHIRIYQKEELMSLLEEAGTRCWRIRYRHGLHAPYWWLKCLVGHKNEPSRRSGLYRTIPRMGHHAASPADGHDGPDSEPADRQEHHLLSEKRIPLMELHLSPTHCRVKRRCSGHGGFHRLPAEGKRRNPLVGRGKDRSLGSCGKRHGA